MTRTDSGTDWEIGEVPAAFASVSRLADECGFLAALFGSTVKQGRGRDLDVAMVSRFRERSDFRKFLDAFGGELVRRLEGPAERGNHSYEVARDGRLYHFCFGRM